MKTVQPILLLISIMALVVGSNAKTAVGTLEGTVIDLQGKGIAGATVMIQSSDGQHPHATRTDASGHFAFAHFATGQYDLRAYSGGSYSEWAKRITIRSQKPTQITLRISVSKS
jgi:hypothetical protein